MASKDIRKFSTIPRESLWWRAKLRTEDVQWVRKHLGRSLDGLREFKAIPSSSVFTLGPLLDSWDKRVVFVENESAPHVHIQMGEPYDYRLAYEKAKRVMDPYLSPHGLFRKLENDFHWHALQFMQQFGPLTWKANPISPHWVSLSDFWDRHTRFVAVSMLWEARSNDESLKQSWQWIYERRTQINRVGPAPFGYMPLWKVGNYSPPSQQLPWERPQDFESAVDNFADLRILRECSLEVVQNELNMHTEDCRQIWMMSRIGNASEDVAFRPTRGFSSLWGAIWDLFGQDASALTYSWKLCLECGRLFYPKDRRSVCCTTKHQALWSKRKWAREHRKSGFLLKFPKHQRPKKETDR